jgi:hypothetical protein
MPRRAEITVSCENYMEYHIRLSGVAPDPEPIADAIRAVDPSVLADIDAAGGVLRIAASIDKAELFALLSQSGLTVAPSQVTRIASICCGGCSG